MRCCYFPTTLLFAVYAGSIAAATTNSHRVLRAATKRSDLLKRETKITQRFESEVVYIDGRYTTTTSRQCHTNAT